MTYITCPICGKKALSVATRCPSCGRAFESPLSRHPPSDSRPRRIPLGVLIAGVAVAAVVLHSLRSHFRAADEVPVAAPKPVALDSPARPAPEPKREVAPVTADSAPAPTLVPAPAPSQPLGQTLTPATERRFARTWVNVRAHRSPRAPVIRILSPGDPVMVDSLSRGWYRAVADGQTLGYVDRSYVERSPPSTPR